MLKNRSIKRLEIKNFQGYDHTVVHFDEGINMVTGTSNAGKSALNRAIYWAFTNKPRGDYFIRKGAVYASVKVIFVDGAELFRFRGIEENFVTIKYPGSAQEKYTRFGSDYPEEVKNFLSMPKENETIGSIFYAEQMSPLFLLNLSSADLPRAIGYLAGSDLMESAAKSMQQEFRQIKRDGDKLFKELKKTESEIKTYNNLDKRIASLDSIKSLKSILVQNENQLELMQSVSAQKMYLQNNINLTQFAIQNLNAKIALKDKAAQLRNDIDSLYAIQSMIAIRKEKQYDISALTMRIGHRNKFFKTYGKQNLTNLKQDLAKLKIISDFKTNADRLDMNIKSINEQLINIEQQEQTWTQLVAAHKEILLEQDYICKTCGQKLFR